MKNHWRDAEAKSFLKIYAHWGEDLALRTYSARLIGQDPALVLHGGGNTSVKTTLRSAIGEAVSVLCVKGSGWNLDTIGPEGHPAIRLDALRRLRPLPELSDEEMVNQLRIHMPDSSGPNPSVETLLHAFLPHKFVDHTHANAVLSLVDQPDAEKRARDWVDGRLGIVPYIMPGFALARLAAEIYEKDPRVEGLLLLKHGIFTFGQTAKESYARMTRWVDSAEKRLAKSRPISWKAAYKGPPVSPGQVEQAANILRGQVPLIIRRRSTPSILQFVNSRQSAVWSQSGPATPDHVIRTKPRPMLLPPFLTEPAYRKAVRSAVEKFKRDYQNYFVRQCRLKKVKKKPLDPFPRVILAPGAGLFAAAQDAKAADAALDIYEATIGIMEKAYRAGRYQSLPEGDIFDMEYWSLEQAKLGKTEERPFSRKIVWISGAASGIGRATADAFGALGAHLFLTDRDAAALKKTIESLGGKHPIAWAVCDVTSERQVRDSFDRCSVTYGGVDIVVSNAGIAPTGDIADLSEEVLRKSFEINFFAHQTVAKAAVAVFRRQGLGGALLFNASKSTFNPGAGFGPYTLPKAGVIALMKQYAVELGPEGIRSNAVNADRVRTGLYADGLLEKRARARGLTVDQYVSGNLLRKEVFPEDVAGAFVWLAQAEKTTGTVIPVDGGNAAAFPR
ncbi:MAG: short-chain dehydrogenase [Elusimicrobia bacterium RIFCSPLOWO2_01_FULL_59_12]|nr:MAG: short-chain dehydrogenase [Elusimicrobia bacterium RIFCSPLOWO2_01_FULL_59_12]